MRLSHILVPITLIAFISTACSSPPEALNPGNTPGTTVNIQPISETATTISIPTATLPTPASSPSSIPTTQAATVQSTPTMQLSSTVQPAQSTIRTGEGLPDFKLPVATGGEIRLSEYIGKKNVVLVFYRAWWCLYCRDQLIELRNHHRKIISQDAVVLAVSTDNLEGAKYAVQTFAAPFPILYDVTTEVPRQYQVFNLHGDGLASASIFIIDKSGQLRFKEVGEVYTHQVSSAKIVTELKKLQK